MKAADQPRFGSMEGVRVLGVGTNIAGPVACTFFAEQGASVIQVESTKAPDMFRNMGNAWAIEHRNSRSIALDVRSEKGEEVLKKLIAQSDILIESSKGGTWKRWGLDDEALWAINPALVIAHVSGYGQTGVDDYISRASFDTIGQAFGGYVAVNGMPDPALPLPVVPYTCDYVTALFTAMATSMALYRARATGEGESVDVAQYEVMARIQGNFLIDAVNGGSQPPRLGNFGNAFVAIPNVMRCADGNCVTFALGGAAVCKRAEELLGLATDPDFEPFHAGYRKADGPRAQKMLEALQAYCDAHSAQEVNDAFNDRQIPCSMIMTFEMMVENEQYQARNTLITWDDPVHDKEVLGVGCIPAFTRNPGQVFRGGPAYGMDNDDVLEELGFASGEIAQMYAEGIIKKS